MWKVVGGMENFAPLLERAFFQDVAEANYVVTSIEGQVPDYIRGTYYINGPARFQRGDFRYRHWLDGDGMVAALNFGHAGIRFTSRFVQSKKWVDEQAAQKPLYRAFGTAFEGDQLVRGIALASPVNVSVYPFANTLLAFGEQGLPYELDPMTLETRGEYTFHKRLNAISPFSAHPKVDAQTGELFNFGISFSATAPALNLYRFGADAHLIYRQRYPLVAPCSIHDFALSKHYAVFYLSPYVLDMERLMREGGALLDALTWQPELGSRLLVVARQTGEAVAMVDVGNRYCLHLANAFEDGNRLTVDVIELDKPVYDQYRVIPDLFSDVRTANPVRLVVDIEAKEVVDRRELAYHHMCDFPAIDSRKAMGSCDDFWVLGISNTPKLGRKFLDQLVHLNWHGAQDIYQTPPDHYLGGEPVFVGKPGEDGGAIICQIFDAQNEKSCFAIFDAFHVAKGPVAKLVLHTPLHLGFHACFHAA